MPRAKADYRAARALISAPYPLATITTRDFPPLVSETVPNGLDQGAIQIESAPALGPEPGMGGLGNGFATLDPLWREIQPAFPAVPYPPSPEKKRRWSAKSFHRGNSTGSTAKPREVEVMSGIEEGIVSAQVPQSETSASGVGGLEVSPA